MVEEPPAVQVYFIAKGSAATTIEANSANTTGFSTFMPYTASGCTTANGNQPLLSGQIAHAAGSFLGPPFNLQTGDLVGVLASANGGGGLPYNVQYPGILKLPDGTTPLPLNGSGVQWVQPDGTAATPPPGFNPSNNDAATGCVNL
jgi:hypothetical protein